MRKFEISTIFRAIDRMSAPINRMTSRLDRFARKARKSMRQVNAVAGKVASTIGRGVTRGFQIAAVAVAGFVAAGAKVAKIGIDFEQAIVNSVVKFPGKIRPGTKAFEEMESAAREIGKTTEFMAKDGAEAIGFLGQAGFEGKQALAALPGVVDLATVSSVDLAQASTMAADTLGAMGLKVKDATKLQANMTRVNDVYTIAQNSANNSVEDLFGALTKAGPMAQKVGVEIEGLSGMIGTLADTGVKGEEAGTALRNIFLRLHAPTGAASKLVKKLAGDLYEGGKATDINKVIERLRVSLGKLSEDQKIPILSKIFGARAVGPALTLLAKGGAGLDAFRDKLLAAGGSAKEVAAAMRNTTGGAVKALQSAIESATISLFKLQNGGLKKTIDKITEWIRANEGLIASKVGAFIEGIANNFDRIVTTLKAVGVAVATVWALAKAIQAVSAVLTLVNLIMLANPMTLVVMGIVAAVALAAGLIVYYWDDIAKGLKWLGSVFSEVWDWIVSYLSEQMDYLIHNGPISWFIAGAALAIKAWQAIVPYIKDVWDAIVSFFSDSIDRIMNSAEMRQFTRFMDTVAELWGRAKSVVVGVWDSMVDGIKAAIDRVLEFLAPVIKPIQALIAAKDELVDGLFGIGGDESGAGAGAGAGPSLVTSGDRIAKTLDEKKITTTRKSELTIRDATGRAERTSSEWDPQITLMPTGTF